MYFLKSSGMSPRAVCGTGIIKPTRSGQVWPWPWTTGGGILLLHTNDSSTPDGTTGKVGGLLPPDPTGRLVPEVDLRGCVEFSDNLISNLFSISSLLMSNRARH